MKRGKQLQQHLSAKSHVHAVDQLVVNWHFTETCNYSCRYCYSTWEKPCGRLELLHDESSSRKLLRELYQFFSPENTENPLLPSLKWCILRLSLAGGEPLVYPKQTAQIAREAKDIGFEVSLISNASLLSQDGLDPLLGNLSVLGISIDSMDAKTCRQIGRADKSGEILSFADHVDTIERIRRVNPEIKVKINTVVSKLNSLENLTEFVERLKPDRWKVLKVLPVVSNELAVSEMEFQSFVDRHRHLMPIMTVEDNSAMTESYLMVDPLGRFFQNKSHLDPRNPYLYSRPIFQVGAETVFER